MENKKLEDELVRAIEPILEKYKKSLSKKGYGKEDKIDWRNFASYDIAKVAIPIIQKAERKAIQDLYQTINGDIVIPKEDWEGITNE